MGTSYLHSSPERTILPNGKPGIMDQWHALFPSIKMRMLYGVCMESVIKRPSTVFVVKNPAAAYWCARNIVTVAQHKKL